MEGRDGLAGDVEETGDARDPATMAGWVLGTGDGAVGAELRPHGCQTSATSTATIAMATNIGRRPPPGRIGSSDGPSPAGDSCPAGWPATVMLVSSRTSGPITGAT